MPTPASNHLQPILTYGSEIYGFENIELLEKVHSNFLRKLTGARKSTPMYMLYGELGRYPIDIVVKTRMISFWNRMISGKEHKLSVIIYKYMLNQNIECKWINKIKEILDKTGHSFLWNNQPFCNTRNLPQKIKHNLIDQFKQDWWSKLENSMKGKIYKSFKSEFGLERYFIKLPKNEIIPLFKYRTANHNLPVERGRYDHTPFENRICTLCNKGESGTEKHYLLSCSYFDNSRNNVLDNPSLHNTDYHFKRLLSADSEDELKKLSRFVNIIIREFKNIN